MTKEDKKALLKAAKSMFDPPPDGYNSGPYSCVGIYHYGDGYLRFDYTRFYGQCNEVWPELVEMRCTRDELQSLRCLLILLYREVGNLE